MTYETLHTIKSVADKEHNIHMSSKTHNKNDYGHDSNVLRAHVIFTDPRNKTMAGLAHELDPPVMPNR